MAVRIAFSAALCNKFPYGWGLYDGDNEKIFEYCKIFALIMLKKAECYDIIIFVLLFQLSEALLCVRSVLIIKSILNFNRSI